MTYKEYINLGFERTECDDSVEFDETGYYGFNLVKYLTENIIIAATAGELDKPKLYIKKSDSDIQYHIIYMSCDAVKDLIKFYK